MDLHSVPHLGPVARRLAVVAATFAGIALGSNAPVDAGVAIEHWNAADQIGSGLVTGDATFAPPAYLQFASQRLVLRSVKREPFPAHLGPASGLPAHLYRVVSGGTARLPGGNVLCGGASKHAAQPTYLVVTHYRDKYLPHRRDVTIGVYRQHDLPTGGDADALCATVTYTEVPR